MAGMRYNRTGRSGLLLPAISLGLWHNFGGDSSSDNRRALCRTAFDLGITHFDLANNYGPPPGSAEEAFGTILRQDFAGRRDELIIASKAGYRMWDGPYGDGGSRKYLMTSCDQSLKRMGLSYVDIFYSHRFDPNTPLEETMGALDSIVRSGRALYAGISNYSAAQTKQAAAILRDLGTPCLIHQPQFSMLSRGPLRDQLFDTLTAEGIGSIAFSPLAQGRLTGRYLGGLPADSRAAKGGFLNAGQISPGVVAKLETLNGLAKQRGQTLAQLALAWVLQHGATSALIGASRPDQIRECAGALEQPVFTTAELAAIDTVCGPTDYFGEA